MTWRIKTLLILFIPSLLFICYRCVTCLFKPYFLTVAGDDKNCINGDDENSDWRGALIRSMPDTGPLRLCSCYLLHDAGTLSYQRTTCAASNRWSQRRRRESASRAHSVKHNVLFFPVFLNYFPEPAVTNHCKSGGFKTMWIYSLIVWEARNTKCGGAVLPLGALRKNSCWPLLAPRSCPAVSTSLQSLPPSSPHLLLCVSNVPLPPSSHWI